MPSCIRCGSKDNEGCPPECYYGEEKEDLENRISVLETKLSLENVTRAFYQATNFVSYKTPKEIIERLHQELNA